MFPKVYLIALVCGAACSVLAQERPVATTPAAGHALFRTDAACNCIKTRQTTANIQSRKMMEGAVGKRTTYATYWTVLEPNREAFRLPVAWEENGETNGLWNYGIVDEGDFNGDGWPDFTWYGGDEASQAMYLFLSAEKGYFRVDVLKTLGKAWEHTTGGAAPNFAVPETTNWYPAQIAVVHKKVGIALDAVIRDKPDPTRAAQPDIRVEIPEADFVQ